jgi:hypothetical protein
MASGIKMHPAGYYLHQSFEAALNVVVDEETLRPFGLGYPAAGSTGHFPFIPGR